MARMMPAPALGAARALFLLDLALAALAWPAALALLPDPPSPADWQGAAVLLLHPLAYLLGLYSLGLYRRDALNEPRQALGRVPVAALLAALGSTAVLALLTPEAGGIGLFAVATIALGVAGCLARLLLAALRRLGLFRRRLLVVGAGQRAWDLVWLLRREARTLAFDIALVHGPGMGEADPRLADDPTLRIFPAGTDFLQAARAFAADQIIVASDERRGLPMPALLACRTAGYPVSEYLRSLEREIGRIDIKRLELGFLVFNEGFGASLLDHALKRALDIAASLLLLALTAPFLLAAAIAVKLQDGGPVLYRQARVTRDGRVFRIMKLRTMRVDAERAGATWAAERDPRITRAGVVLRRTRLDELPQLFNVLKGDMSIVGPRPERPEFTAELAQKLPLYEERHRMRAGLTGWAQVNYPYGASLDDARSKLSYDLYYVKNFGVLFDLLILMQTLRVVLFPGNAVR
jgi:sugar transferase (PEP-CTERM system associated)